MANSSILGGEEVPAAPPGHTTKELGPSDTSDSGSDIASGPGTARAGEITPDRIRGTTSDMDRGLFAGADVGDSNLDSDTDSFGTGERMAAGRDSTAREADDIQPDQVVIGKQAGMTEGSDPEGVGVSDDSSEFIIQEGETAESEPERTRNARDGGGVDERSAKSS